jgi:hypothetical protein
MKIYKFLVKTRVGTPYKENSCLFGHEKDEPLDKGEVSCHDYIKAVDFIAKIFVYSLSLDSENLIKSFVSVYLSWMGKKGSFSS